VGKRSVIGWQALAQAGAVVVVDKPAGLSSAQTLARVKRLFEAKKAGHAGTLDPFATGVMVCCLDQATRLADFFLGGEKTYAGTMVLGIATDTQDATGRVIATAPVPELDKAAIAAVFARFTGTVNQVPPAFSALKHQGVALYKLARQGQPVVKPARPVTIMTLDVEAVCLPRITFTVTCSAGTYIRTLCSDIGLALGCGGHLQELRRMAASGFTIAEAATIEELAAWAEAGTLAQRLIGMAEALRHLPAHRADAALASAIAHGRPIGPSALPGVTAGLVKVVDGGGRLLAVLHREVSRPYFDYRGVFTPPAKAVLA